MGSVLSDDTIIVFVLFSSIAVLVIREDYEYLFKKLLVFGLILFSLKYMFYLVLEIFKFLSVRG